MDYEDLYDPEKFFEAKESLRLLNKKLHKLSSRQESIIRMFFGVDQEKLSYKQIGEKFNVTGLRIKKLVDNSLRILKGKPVTKIETLESTYKVLIEDYYLGSDELFYYFGNAQEHKKYLIEDYPYLSVYLFKIKKGTLTRISHCPGRIKVEIDEEMVLNLK